MRLYNFIYIIFNQAKRNTKADILCHQHYCKDMIICSRGREKYFGEVKEGIVELSEIGEAVKEELLKTMEIRPNVNIDEWVIMPNHVHVIVALDNQNNERQYNGSITCT